MERPDRNLDPLEFDDETIAALVELGELLRSIRYEAAEKIQPVDAILSPPNPEV